MSTVPPTPPPVAEPNPLANALTAFIGSANFQKSIAGLQVGIAALTKAESTNIWARIGFAALGGAYGLGVHYVDYLRAKIGR